MTHFSSVDDYIASFDQPARGRLAVMRRLIRSVLPQAEERISYNMPAYFVNGKLVVYFAGFKNHLGMYPGRTNSQAYNQLAARYAYGKSTARFLHAEPLPRAIIKQYINLRLQEVDSPAK